MPKKAKRRNGYFYFMLDFKRREEQKGVNFAKGFADVAIFAADEWKNLPQHMKEKYNDKAKVYNQSEFRNQGGSNNSASSSRRIGAIPVPREPNEREVVEKMIKGKSLDEILDHNFYLIHVNMFLLTEDECFPAELSISQFNLRQGVTKVFHRFFNPGKFPLGFELTVREHIEKTHRIPIDLNKSDRGYLGMYNYILKFLKEDNNGEIPPLFTMPDNPFMNFSLKAAKFALKRIWETGNEEEDEEDGELEEQERYEKIFKVNNLILLFYVLKEKCVKLLDFKGTAFINTQLAKFELEKDTYGFDPDIACQFHQTIDRVQYCSQSYTVRWGRVIREKCCGDLIESEESDEAEEENGRIKQERDMKIERDRIKEEITPAVIKNERDVKAEKINIKTEKEQNAVPSTSGMQRKDSSKVKSEKEDPPVSVKSERRETAPIRVKTEKPELSPAIPSSSVQTSQIRIKTENPDRPAISSSTETQIHGSLPIRIKTEKPERSPAIPSSSIQASPIKIKAENSDGTANSSSTEIQNHGSLPISIKTEKPDISVISSSTETRSYESPLITIKTENLNAPTSIHSSIDIDYHEIPLTKVKTEIPDIPPRISSTATKTGRQETSPIRIKTEPTPLSTDIEMEVDRIPTPPPAPIIRPKLERGLSPTRVDGEKTPPRPTLVRSEPQESIRIKSEPQSESIIRIKSEPQDPPRIHSEREKTPNRDPRLCSNTESPQRDPRLQTISESRDPRNRSQSSSIPIPCIKLEKDIESITENVNKRPSSSLISNSSDIKRQRQTVIKEEKEITIKEEPVEYDTICQLKHEECDLGYDFISNNGQNAKNEVNTVGVDISNCGNGDFVTVKTEHIVSKIKKEIVTIDETESCEQIKNENIAVKEEIFTTHEDLD